MEERLREFEAHRQQVCKKANIFIAIGVSLLIIGIIVIAAFANPAFVFFVVAGVIFMAIGSSKKGKLSAEFKDKFIIDLVKEVYPESTYNPKGGIEIERILEPGLFKRPDRYYLEDYLKASFDNVPFEMCDFEFKERRVTTNSKGQTTTTYVTYAKGRFMIFDFARDFKQVLKVAENAYLGLSTRGLEKVETESLDFNEKFKTFASDPLTAFYVLTPQIQLKILELESKFKGSIYLAYMNGKLYMAVSDGVSILNINASKKVSKETLEVLESQLNLPASIINELGLSSAKFTEGEAI